MGIWELLNKLEAEERAFVARQVLAPVLAGRAVAVRIAGIVCTLRVESAHAAAEVADGAAVGVSGGRPDAAPLFTGWAILQPLAMDRARIVRPAQLGEMRAYLRLFPAVRLIAMARVGMEWQALLAHTGDTRFQIAGPAPVLLAEEGVQPFETVVARFDGRFFWYERRDGRRNPALAAYLREALNAHTKPSEIAKPGLSAEERAAYEWVWRLAERARLSDHETRLSEALAHAGARLLAFIERSELYTVTYEIGGQRCVSNVDKRDLTVLTAGICLSGRDRDFDLASLVGVMREAEGRPIPRWNVAPEEDV